MKLMERFNTAPAEDADGRRAILAELLGEVGEDVEIRPPLYCDYGYQVREAEESQGRGRGKKLKKRTKGKEAVEKPDYGYQVKDE